jgi:hypothetical protein
LGELPRKDLFVGGKNWIYLGKELHMVCNIP